MDTRPLLGHLVKDHSSTRLALLALIAFLTFYVTTGYDTLPSTRTNTPEAIEYKPWQGALELSLPSTLYHDTNLLYPRRMFGYLQDGVLA